jgi:hypothetical protein
LLRASDLEINGETTKRLASERVADGQTLRKCNIEHFVASDLRASAQFDSEFG